MQVKIPQATLLSDALQKILWLMRHPKNDLKEGQRPPCWEILASMNTLPRETDLLKTGKVKYYSITVLQNYRNQSNTTYYLPLSLPDIPSKLPVILVVCW